METNPSVAETAKSVERRKGLRYRCQASVEIRAKGSGNVLLWATATDLSQSGCYVESPSPLSSGQSVELTFSLSNTSFDADARVTVVHPMFGMGLEFTSIAPDKMAVLRQMLTRLAEDGAPIEEAVVQADPALQPQPEYSAVAPGGSEPAASTTIRISGEAAASLLAEIGRQLAKSGVLTAQDFSKLLEKHRNS